MLVEPKSRSDGHRTYSVLSTTALECDTCNPKFGLIPWTTVLQVHPALRSRNQNSASWRGNEHIAAQLPFSFLSFSSVSSFYPRQIKTASSFLTTPFSSYYQCSLLSSPLHSDQTMMFRSAAIGRILSGLDRSRSLSTIASCRAVLVPRFGRPDVLEVRSDVSVPDLKPKEVLVGSRAVAINPLDLRMREGYGRSIFESLLPIIIGRDVSGEVAAVGSSVSSLKVGQEVFGALHPTAVRGTYTDYAILSEDELTIKPSTLSHVEASAIPFPALTAWRALHSTARITDCDRVLIIGGGGAVGFTAIQLAVAVGCKVATTCGPESVDRLLSAGVEQAVDYTSEDIEFVIKGRFDAVLDTIGGPETERIGVNLLKKGGHYMTLQGEAASLADKYGLAVGLPAATAILLKKQCQYRYSHGIEYSWTFMRADMEGLEGIRRLAEAGKLHVPVEKTFPLSQVKEAHEAKEKRLVPGKVVLEVD